MALMTNNLEYPDSWHPSGISNGIYEIMEYYGGKLENYPVWLTEKFINLPRYRVVHTRDVTDPNLIKIIHNAVRLAEKVIWIMENTEKDWYAPSRNLFWFQDPDDALLFKMTWG